jgi:hypothetical protein
LTRPLEKLSDRIIPDTLVTPGSGDELDDELLSQLLQNAIDQLIDYKLVDARLRRNEVEGWLEDLENATQAVQHDIELNNSDTLHQWATFARERAHILRRGNEYWPANRILLQLAMEHADDSPVTKAAEEWVAADHCDWTWLRSVRRPGHMKSNPCLLSFDGPGDYRTLKLFRRPTTLRALFVQCTSSNSKRW